MCLLYCISINRQKSNIKLSQNSYLLLRSNPLILPCFITFSELPRFNPFLIYHFIYSSNIAQLTHWHFDLHMKVWKLYFQKFRARTSSLLTWNLQRLGHIATITGQQYNDAYYVWKRFYNLPESYTITYSVLTIAQKHNLPVEKALACYLNHLGSPL